LTSCVASGLRLQYHVPVHEARAAAAVAAIARRPGRQSARVSRSAHLRFGPVSNAPAHALVAAVCRVAESKESKSTELRGLEKAEDNPEGNEVEVSSAIGPQCIREAFVTVFSDVFFFFCELRCFSSCFRRICRRRWHTWASSNRFEPCFARSDASCLQFGCSCTVGAGRFDDADRRDAEPLAGAHLDRCACAHVCAGITRRFFDWC
jgi:hypothetical protein